MEYIKVPAIDSTNEELRRRLKRGELTQNTCLSTTHQTKGRGQRGTQWKTEPHKNLTFSILLKNIELNVQDNFKTSMLVSLALIKVLTPKIPKYLLSIKWPNDILAGQHKITGILIENTLAGNHIKNSIIGIGINVNQTNFEQLSRASSLKLLTGQTFNLDILLCELCENIIKEVQTKLHLPHTEIMQAYEHHLFARLKQSTFALHDGTIKKGYIQGITPRGKLKINFEDNTTQHFGLKEIQLIY